MKPSPSKNILTDIDKLAPYTLLAGFPLIAKKLLDQLEDDIKQSRIVAPKTKKNKQHDTLAKNKIRTMRKFLLYSHAYFYDNNIIDDVIALYNEFNSARLKLHCEKYKKWINNQALDQICTLVDLLDPNCHPHDGRSRHQIFNFFLQKVLTSEKNSAHLDDCYLWVMFDTIQAIDRAMAAMDNIDGIMLNPIKKRAESFSGHASFQQQLLNLYAFYELDSIYFPQLMNPEWKAYYITYQMNQKKSNMINHDYYQSKKCVENIVDPILSNLSFLRDSYQLRDTNIIKTTLENHIDQLIHSTDDCDKITKAIKLDTAQYMIVIYEQILNREFQSKDQTSNELSHTIYCSSKAIILPLNDYKLSQLRR